MQDSIIQMKQKKKIGDSETEEKHHFWGKKRPGATSKYFGVSWHEWNKSWKVQIRINKKVIVIGKNKDEIIAAKMYDAFVIENNLSNPLNFP